MDEKHRKKKEAGQEKSRGETHPKAEEKGQGPAEAPVEKATEKPAEEPVDVEDLKVKARERGEFLDMLQRTYAEYSNYRKRIERERGEWTDRAVGEFVNKLLPVLDDFDRALGHAAESADPGSFVEGVRLIESKIYEVLKSGGVEAFEPEPGTPFNPAEQEVLIVETTDELPDGSVTEVLLKGYRLRERVLRTAKVKVTKKPPAEAATQAPAEGAQESGEKTAEAPDATSGTGTGEGKSDADV